MNSRLEEHVFTSTAYQNHRVVKAWFWSFDEISMKTLHDAQSKTQTQNQTHAKFESHPDVTLKPKFLSYNQP